MYPIRAPVEWNPAGTHCLWKLNAPLYGLKDAPAALRKTPRRYLLRSETSPDCVGLKFQASSFGPRLSRIFRGGGGAAATFLDAGIRDFTEGA